MPATVIVGAQWGDEGKGKIVDLLAQESDVVCRYQGGPNAGTRSIVGGETFKFRQLPSGSSPARSASLGAGCVVDPQVLLGEIDDLEARGISADPLKISGNAHLIMPWHIAIDGASEKRLGKLQIGTTRRGIGPAYADKAARIGIRVQDLLDPKILRQKIETALAEKNVWLVRVYEHEPFELEDVASRYEAFAQRLRPYVADTSLLVDDAIRAGQRVLLEGAQGTLLDLDHGTYPFVTSSTRSPARRAPGSGSGRRASTRCSASRRRTSRASAKGRSRARSRRDRRPASASSGRSSARSPAASGAAAGSISSRSATPSGSTGSRARDDEARRALRLRRAPGLRPLPPARRDGDSEFPAHQSTSTMPSR